MNPIEIGIIGFAFAFGGVALGVWLRSVLPKHHLDKPSEDAMKRGVGLIATMTALVLSLVMASAKSSFEGVKNAVKESAVQVLALDRVLARYGPETREIRRQLKQVVGERIDMIWPSDSSRPVALDQTTAGMTPRAESLTDAIRSLQPRDDLQRALQTRAVDLAERMLQAPWLVMGTEGSVPTPFLVILLFWLTAIFASFAVFAPRNGTLITILFVCSLSIGGALFLVPELAGPFDGLIRVSSDPIRFAYTHINR
ncbi:MAG: hypothetical protein ACM3NQ_25035 [Bacteroidales bacterium]